MIVAIRLHIDDHRIVIGRTGVPTWPAWPVAGIEHTQHIKKDMIQAYRKARKAGHALS